jgi:hypothetical protein
MPRITETITITWHRFAEEKPEYRRDLLVIPEDATKHNYIKAVFLEDNIVYPMVDLDPIFPTKQQKLLWTYKDQIIYDRKPERSPAPLQKPYDTRLLELLHTLPQETQDKFLVIATNYADRYCEEYDIHLEEFRRIGYLRQLSKQVYCALNTKLYYDKNHDPQEVKDIFEIANYFHSRFTWLLNDNIMQRSKGLNAPLEEIPL